MHNQNEAFLHLNDALPADIARRRDMGDLAGALQLIDARLSSGVQPLLAPRLEAERLRLTRLPYDYPYTRPEAVALVRAEWPGFTEAQFDALLDCASTRRRHRGLSTRRWTTRSGMPCWPGWSGKAPSPPALP